MSLSDGEVDRLAAIVERNRQRGGDPGAMIGDDHPVVEAVRDELPRCLDAKRHWKAKEIAARLDADVGLVSKALRVCAAEGLVTPMRGWKGKTYRVEDAARGGSA